MSQRIRLMVYGSAAIGMMAGIAVMTLVGTKDQLRTMNANLPPRLLTVGLLAARCGACREAMPCGPGEMVSYAYCLGILAGVLDGRPDLARLCLPADWDGDDAAALFLAWAGRHPEWKDWPTSTGIVAAYMESFDCRNPGKDA